MVIYFLHQKPKKYLLDHGEIITYRRNSRRYGRTTIIFNKKTGEKAEGFVKLLKTLDKDISESLKPYVSKTGFETLDEWMQAIIYLDAKRRKPEYGYLYHVRLITNPLHQQSLNKTKI